jgi:uncharacterized membrane protein YphA (DoxX/SURF4 family)
MSEAVVRTISLLLASVFAWAAVAKVVRFGAWRSVLAGYRLPAGTERPIAVLVPLVEVAVAALLLIGETRAGAALSVMLLSSFSLALVRARALQGDRLPCGCFGATKERDYKLLLLRNGVLALLPAALLLGGRDVVPTSGVGWPSMSDALPTLLTLAGLVAALWIAREVASSFKKGRP